MKIKINEEVIRVSDLNRLAKALLENNMPICWIKGEISGIRNYSHVYFDLKDEGAKVSCVVFANIVNSLNFKLENGQQIEVRGKITIYPQNGSYQINVERVRSVGIGELWEAYHRLVNKLRLEGLFAPERKMPIPIFPKVIGVITSKEGAVIRDIITTLKRRMPNITIIVYHSAVQGSDAGMQLAKAIKTANRRNEVDVLIICRGGGSMEDLWCFNEEVVAREVFASRIPIISAVGHETDTTIIDFVADLRAPTPTSAAELVAKSRSEWLELLNKLTYRLKNAFNYEINDYKQLLDLYMAKLMGVVNPINQVRKKIYMLDKNQQQLHIVMHKLLNMHQMQLSIYKSKILSKRINCDLFDSLLKNAANRLISSFLRVLRTKENYLLNLNRHLNLVNPQNILERGYAIVKTTNNKIVYSPKDIKHNERLEVVFYDDSLNVIADKLYGSGNKNKEK